MLCRIAIHFSRQIRSLIVFMSQANEIDTSAAPDFDAVLPTMVVAANDSPKPFGFGTQIRKSAYFDATVRWGATAFSVYNHMYIPRDFGDPQQNFWNLVNAATLSDGAVERQVEITGPDAATFVKMLTPRNLST